MIIKSSKMRTIFFLFIISLFIKSTPIHAQIPKEMQMEMQKGVNKIRKQITDLEKQIAEAKKNKEDTETIKGMEEQLSALKQQLGMIQKMTGTVSKISSKEIQLAIDDNDPGAIKKFPKKNPALLESLPKLSSKEA